MVDASFAGAWLLPDEASRGAHRVLRDSLAGKTDLCVPRLWIYEMSNLLLTAAKRKRVTSEQVVAAHELLDALPRQTLDHESLLARERITTYALRYGLSAYDATYLELADRLQCGLATLDQQLSRAAAKASIEVTKS